MVTQSPDDFDSHLDATTVLSSLRKKPPSSLCKINLAYPYAKYYSTLILVAE